MTSGPGQIDTLLSGLRETTRRAETLFAAKSAKQLSGSPGGKGWSATQCVAHLNLTNRAYLPLIEACLEELKRQNLRGDGPFKMTWNAWLLNWWLEPPSRLRRPTAPLRNRLISSSPIRSSRNLARSTHKSNGSSKPRSALLSIA